MVKEPDGATLFDEISFACSKKQPRIQIGDLLARETMKHLDNIIGPKQRITRKSMTALQETEHFGFNFYMREYFEDLRRKFVELGGKAGISWDLYLSWLKDRRIHDGHVEQIQIFSLGE